MFKMDKKNLLNAIKIGESQTVEFTKDIKEIGKSICSFANTNDGVIFLGVSDDGTIIGTNKKYEQAIANTAHTCKPSIYPEIENIEIDGKCIFIVKVKKSDQIHSYRNIAYKRIGTHDKPLSSDEVIEFAREIGEIRFDSQICMEANLEDIDEEKVNWYLERRENIRKIPKEINIERLLLSIGAAKEIKGKVKPTNAGILFFAGDPQRFFSQARILTVRFEGTEISRTTIDSLDCSGTLWEMLNQAEDFVRKNIRLYGFRTPFTFRRIDKLEYPLDAIGEAITNALIHRDYFDSPDIKVFIFDDRIEITNPGSFPAGVTPEKPIHKPRNPILCQLMRDAGFIEKYGSGIYFMKNLCMEWGVSEPEFILDRIQTKVIFRSASKGILIPELRKIGVEINDRQKNALEYILEQGRITNKEYAMLYKVSRNTATNDLIQLAELGLVKRVGKGRGSYYIPNI